MLTISASVLCRLQVAGCMPAERICLTVPYGDHLTASANGLRAPSSANIPTIIKTKYTRRVTAFTVSAFLINPTMACPSPRYSAPAHKCHGKTQRIARGAKADMVNKIPSYKYGGGHQ